MHPRIGTAEWYIGLRTATPHLRGGVNWLRLSVPKDVRPLLANKWECSDSYPPQPFAEAVRAFDGLLFRAGQRADGIIPLSPAEIEAGRGVQMLACAATLAEARELSDRALGTLFGSRGIPDPCAAG